MVTTDTFRLALNQIFEDAQTKKLPFIEVRSGDLHTSLGASARMPSCCNAMRNLMNSRDEIVKKPPKGNGANLVIRYHLPRDTISLNKGSIQKPVITQATYDEGINKKILTLSVCAPDLTELEMLEQLMRVDPESAMIKIRKVAEKISKRICVSENLPSQITNFDDLCRIIANNQILSKKAVRYLNDIRIKGNISAHSHDRNDEKFTDNDVMVVINALFAVVEEARDKKLM